jgi:bifunctional polynucleotide phosphatase/kinase
MYWIKVPYLHVKSNNFIYKAKIAAFDIDGTIITTKSNKKFPVNKNDWKFLYDTTILEKLKELYNNDYCIIFISNQGGIKSETQTNDWTEKMQNVAAEIQKYEKNNIPISIYAATSDYLYRKPLPKLWNAILDELKNMYKNILFVPFIHPSKRPIKMCFFKFVGTHSHSRWQRE